MKNNVKVFVLLAAVLGGSHFLDERIGVNGGYAASRCIANGNFCLPDVK